MYQLHLSDRGIPLIYVGPIPSDYGILTVENYSKWYAVYVVNLDGTVVPIDVDLWGHLVPIEDIAKLVERTGCRWDISSLEIIIGRWEFEHKNAYDSLYSELDTAYTRLGIDGY